MTCPECGIHDSWEECLSAAQAENAILAAWVANYEEVHEDKKRLCREIGVILHGEGAAKQPSLCDLVGPIEDLKAENAALKDALATVTYKEGALCEIVKEYADLKRENAALVQAALSEGIARAEAERASAAQAARVAELEEKLRREDMCTRHALNNLGLMEAESAALTQQVAQEQEAFQILHRSFEAAEAEATRYREALEQLVHQITINDFADSLGHKATGLMALLNAKAALRPARGGGVMGNNKSGDQEIQLTPHTCREAEVIAERDALAARVAVEEILKADLTQSVIELKAEATRYRGLLEELFTSLRKDDCRYKLVEAALRPRAEEE